MPSSASDEAADFPEEATAGTLILERSAIVSGGDFIVDISGYWEVALLREFSDAVE